MVTFSLNSKSVYFEVKSEILSKCQHALLIYVYVMISTILTLLLSFFNLVSLFFHAPERNSAEMHQILAWRAYGKSCRIYTGPDRTISTGIDQIKYGKVEMMEEILNNLWIDILNRSPWTRTVQPSTHEKFLSLNFISDESQKLAHICTEFHMRKCYIPMCVNLRPNAAFNWNSALNTCFSQLWGIFI